MSGEETVDKVKTWLWPLAFITVTIGLITGAVQAWTKFWDLLDRAFYPTIIFTFVAGILLSLKAPLGWLRRSAKHKSRVRAILCGMVIFFFLLAIGLRIYDIYWRNQGESEPYKHMKNEKTLSMVQSAYAAKDSVLKLIFVGVDGRLSSYVEHEGVLFGHGKRIRTFAADLDVLHMREIQQCTGENGDQPMALMVKLLRKRLVDMGRTNFLKYIKSTNDLWRLMNKQKDRFREIMFSPMEVDQMRKKEDSDFETVMEFTRSCHGQLNPVLRATLRNASKSTAYVNAVIYNVLKVGDVKGGAAGLNYPDEVFTHILRWEKGEQKVVFPSPITIPSGNDFTIGLKLIPDIPDGIDPYGRAWHMRLAFIDSNGGRVESEPFQLIMSKQ